MARRLFLVILIGLGLSRVSADDQSQIKTDTAQLQGEWMMVSGQRDGQPVPESNLPGYKRVAKDNETTVTSGGQLFMKANFTLDPSKTPKAIDYKITGGPHLGGTQLGIYEFSGDTVKFCFATPGRERPQTFTTSPGDGRTLSVWKRAAK